MLDIVNYNGQPALSINGTIIGTEEEILQELQKSNECNTWKKSYFEMKELYDNLAQKTEGLQ